VHNGRPAAAGRALLGLDFVFVSPFFSFLSFALDHMPRLAGCRLVCALHEHAAHTRRSLDKKFKYTNLFEVYTMGVIFSRG